MKRNNKTMHCNFVYRICILLVLGFGLVSLVSCPAKTYYLRSANNGFTDMKISDTVYTITVKSRNLKDVGRLQDIFYLRAAEISKENGHPFFFTVENTEYLSDMNPKGKPFKQIKLTIAFYESLTITGIVKLLSEIPEDIPFTVHNAEITYNKREYLIQEKNTVFGGSTNDVSPIAN